MIDTVNITVNFDFNFNFSHLNPHFYTFHFHILLHFRLSVHFISLVSFSLPLLETFLPPILLKPVVAALTIEFELELELEVGPRRDAKQAIISFALAGLLIRVLQPLFIASSFTVEPTSAVSAMIGKLVNFSTLS